jgi:transposase-like protein
MGRPSKITPELEEAVLRALEGGADMALAARVAGVARSTLYRHMDHNESFAELAEEARNVADSKVVESLFSQAVSGNTTAMIFWLKNRRPEEWRDRQQVEHSGEGAPVRLLMEVVKPETLDD